MTGANSNKMSVGGWVAVGFLLVALVATCAYAFYAWNLVSGEMSGVGWGFMIAGVVVSVALGGGLMALAFYSARHNLDR